MPTYRSARTRATWVIVLVLIVCVLSATELRSLNRQASLLAELEMTAAAEGGFLSPAQMDAVRDMARGQSARARILFAVVAIPFLIWTYRVCRNLAALGVARQRVSPVWAVVCWFIPVLNFVMPCWMMSRVWNGSLEANDQQPSTGIQLLLLLTWWVPLVGRHILNVAGAWLSREAVTAGTIWMARTESVATICAGLALIYLVNRITTLQDEAAGEELPAASGRMEPRFRVATPPEGGEPARRGRFAAVLEIVRWQTFAWMPRWLLRLAVPGTRSRPGDTPGSHSEYEIGWSLADSWPQLVEEYLEANDSTTPEAVSVLRRAHLKVVFVERVGRNRAVATVRPTILPQRLPDEALGLLMGVTPAIAPPLVDAIHQENEDWLYESHLLVFCTHDGSRWLPEVMDVSWDMGDVLRWRKRYWTEPALPNNRYLAARRRPSVDRPLAPDPTRHGDEDIASAIESRWDEIVNTSEEVYGEYLSHRGGTFRDVEVEVLTIDRWGPDRAAAFVRTNMDYHDLPGLALALLLGTRADLAHQVNQTRRAYISGELENNWLVVHALYEDGQWGFANVDSLEADMERNVAIGEPIQLQTSWKEPPFEVIVLAPPEAVTNDIVAVPMRVRSMLPLWSYRSVGGSIPAYLATSDESEIWDTVYEDLQSLPDHLNIGHNRDLPLVLGGSLDGVLYFRRSKDARLQPDFVQIGYFDETEYYLAVDLADIKPAPERARFTPLTAPSVWANPTQDNLDDRLRGSQWETIAIEQLEDVWLGDTVKVVTPEGAYQDNAGQPWYAFTVLDLPEPHGDHRLRLSVRITSLSEDLECGTLDFQLSSSPDEHGQLHHLLDSEYLTEPDRARPQSLAGVTLQDGQSSDGYLYFYDEDSDKTPDADLMTLLWYGQELFRKPLMLRPPNGSSWDNRGAGIPGDV